MSTVVEQRTHANLIEQVWKGNIPQGVYSCPKKYSDHEYDKENQYYQYLTFLINSLLMEQIPLLT